MVACNEAFGPETETMSIPFLADKGKGRPIIGRDNRSDGWANCDQRRAAVHVLGQKIHTFCQRRFVADTPELRPPSPLAFLECPVVGAVVVIQNVELPVIRMIERYPTVILPWTSGI